MAAPKNSEEAKKRVQRALDKFYRKPEWLKKRMTVDWAQRAAEKKSA